VVAVRAASWVGVVRCESSYIPELLNTLDTKGELGDLKAELLNTTSELGDLKAKVAALTALKTQTQTSPASGEPFPFKT
jgi:hypothetical protein